jgi:hypothetical protein
VTITIAAAVGILKVEEVTTVGIVTVGTVAVTAAVGTAAVGIVVVAGTVVVTAGAGKERFQCI